MALRYLRGQRKDITKRGDQFQFPFQRAGKFQRMSIGRYGARCERTGSGKQHGFLLYSIRRHDNAAGH